MTSKIVIRPLREDERSVWEPLWQGYLAFYKTRLPQENTDIAWERFHDAQEPMFALGAFVDGALTGIVHYLFHRSSWTPGHYCYLQDLFVTEKARGLGVGRALIDAVYERARAEGASRVYWLTQNDNMQARILYDRIAENSGFMVYRKIF